MLLLRCCCCCLVAKSCVTLCNPWTAAHQASLSFTISQSLLKLLSVELVMSSNHLILCHPLLLLPSTFPSITVFSNESALCIRWPKYWNFNTIGYLLLSLKKEGTSDTGYKIDELWGHYAKRNKPVSHKETNTISSGDQSIRASASASVLAMNIQGWFSLGFDRPAVQGNLKSLLQHHSSKASILGCSAFFMVQFWHPDMTTGKTIALIIWTFASKVKSLLFNMLSRFVIIIIHNDLLQGTLTLWLTHS